MEHRRFVILFSVLPLLAACGGRSSIADGRDELSPSGPSSGIGIAGGGAAGVASAGTAGIGSGGTAGTGFAAGSGGAAGMPSLPLWRASSQAYCGTPGATLNRNPIWSDARGVYLLTSTGTQSSIQFNDGTGWKLLTQSQESPAQPSLTGFVGGPLVEYGSSACAITFVDEKSNSCSAASSQVTGISIVDAQLGYAVYRDRVLRYDGAFWTQWGPALSGDSTYAWGIWASKDSVVVVADAGKIYLQRGGGLQLESGVPYGDYRAAWGFAADDIWAGNTLGQLVHFDGKSWSVAATIGGGCAGVRSLWGSEGVLFFTTDHSLGMWKAGVVQLLADLPCAGSPSVMGAWGNSKQELFIALQANEQTDAQCAGIQLLWFDGTALKPL